MGQRMKLTEILQYSNANGKPYMCDLKKLDKYEVQELLSEHKNKRNRQQKPSRAKA